MVFCQEYVTAASPDWTQYLVKIWKIRQTFVPVEAQYHHTRLKLEVHGTATYYTYMCASASDCFWVQRLPS